MGKSQSGSGSPISIPYLLHYFNQTYPLIFTHTFSTDVKSPKIPSGSATNALSDRHLFGRLPVARGQRRCTTRGWCNNSDDSHDGLLGQWYSKCCKEGAALFVRTLLRKSAISPAAENGRKRNTMRGGTIGLVRQTSKVSL